MPQIFLNGGDSMAPCSDAMIKEVLTLKPDQTVAEAMEIYKKENICAHIQK